MPNRPLVLSLAAFGSGLLAACRPDTVVGPASAGQPVATAANGAITVTNPTTRPLFTFVVGRDRASLILWGPCADAARCPPLAAGGSQRVAYPSAAVPAGEREVLVYWWHARPAPDGAAPEADSVRALTVPLPR